MGLLGAIPVFVFTLWLVSLDATINTDAKYVLCISILMAWLWITEALPIPATALIPMALFPILGVQKAKEVGISEHKLRLVHVYKEDENKVITIITNQLEWSYETIASLYKKRWDIELFFKAIKQNLQIKTF